MAENWGQKLALIAEKGKVDLGQFARDTKIEMFSAVVRFTRVDTGRLRGNWQIQDGAKPEGFTEEVDPGPEGVVTSEMKGRVDKATESGKTYFVNNLPYAKVYEDEDAMVGRAVAGVKAVIDAQIKKIRAGK